MGWGMVKKKLNFAKQQVTWEEGMKLKAAWLFWIMDECQSVKVKQDLEISLAELKTWEINYFN